MFAVHSSQVALAVSATRQGSLSTGVFNASSVHGSPHSQFASFFNLSSHLICSPDSNMSLSSSFMSSSFMSSSFMSLSGPSSSSSSSSGSSPILSSGEDSLDGWPQPEDYFKTFSELKQCCEYNQDGGSQDSWRSTFSPSSGTLSPPNEEAADFIQSAFNAPLTWPPLELSKLRAPGVNYYPNFDPKDYFCDTVAVENASMVAQIVGKKGAKIKHLVSKYGIRIRTPNMDQEPVFVIRGKRADVYSVKQEIQSAATHFMQIEKMKQDKLTIVMSGQSATAFKLFIPTRYVGLVIGRNGRIVRDLQTTHNVHIETPKFDIRQYFIVYGSCVSIEVTLKSIKELLIKKSGIIFTELRKKPDEVHYIE